VNDATRRSTELDRRLARLLGSLDAGPGFAARLAGRIAHERPAVDAAALARAREQALRERLAAEAALRRRLRSNLLLVAGAAIAAVGPAWICGGVLARLLGALPRDGGPWLAGASVALLAGWLWPVLARAARGALPTALRA
jgi:hypothetical protein